MGRFGKDHLQIASPTGRNASAARSFHSRKYLQSVDIFFILLATCLALPGISPYLSSLHTVCSGTDCLVGQLSPLEKIHADAFGFTLSEYAFYTAIIQLTADLLLILLAAIITWRKPYLLSSMTAVFFLAALGTSNLILAAARELPALQIPGLLMQAVQYAALLPLYSLLPDRRFRTRWLPWASLVLIPLFSLAALGWVDPSIGRLAGLFAVGLLFGGLINGYRKSAGTPQQEVVAWALASAVLLTGTHWMGSPVEVLPLPTLTLDQIPVNAFGFYSFSGFLVFVGALTCLAVIFLGDELFRVDVALNRAVVYSLLTLFIIAGYVLIVGYLSLVFQSVDNIWLSLVATGIVAALFHPLRERVQRFVNRMIYGERDDPYTAITRLGQRLETTIASDEVITAILRDVREALKVSYAAIWLNQGESGDLSLGAEDGRPVPVELSLPLVYRKEMVGRLDLGPRHGENKFSSADRRLLDGLASLAGAAIHAARLNADLKQARERLVLAREEERRRIRRDLHDGLGSSLAALNLQAGGVLRLMHNDPDTARRRMDDLRAGLRAAVGDTRRLVYGLRPPALDELGLREALRSRIAQYRGETHPQGGKIDRQDGTAVQISFSAPEQLPLLPAAVEVAVYRIVEEGLANIIHHAQAQSAAVFLALVDEGISITLQDDGIGLPDMYQSGVGLNSMRERAAELGGEWSIQSSPGQGTRVRAWLPLSSGFHEG